MTSLGVSTVDLSREILDSVLERAADEVFLLNPDGSVKYVNQSTLDRRGYSMDEMLRLSVWDWNTFVTEKSWARRWSSLLELHRARFETRHTDKKGISFPVDIQAHYLRFGDQEYCACFVNDISELAEKVFELGRKHLELESAQRRAVDALESLQELQDRRSLLFATIAHELRTPISAISMLSADESADTWHEARQHVQALARDLLHTLDDMRRLTSDNHTREITLENFTLRRLLESVQLSVSAYISRCQMGFEVRSAEGTIREDLLLSGDLYRLKIVLSNLVKNACLHSGGRHITIELSSKPLSGDGVELNLRVQDDGKGIPPEQVETLFSPYSRGSTEADGSGLGLHIARSWIEELGGTLNSIPTPIGALFELRVPLKTAQPADDKASLQSVLLEPLISSAVDPSTLDVLFVEDDLMIQMVGRKLLSKLFASVEIAGDGLEAVDKLRQQSFDLILTDYFMPNMNGLELIEQLRKTGYSGVIYACSAATLGSEFDDLVAAGANDVFSKPLTINKLMACLENDSGIFTKRQKTNSSGDVSMDMKDITVADIIESSSQKALLLIDLESGKIVGTDKWRALNGMEPSQVITRTLLNQTIAPESRNAFVDYSTHFFSSPVDNPAVSIDLNLRSLNGRAYTGRVSAYKVVAEGRVLACTEVQEI